MLEVFPWCNISYTKKKGRWHGRFHVIVWQSPVPGQDGVHCILLKDRTAPVFLQLHSCLLVVSITISPGALLSPRIELVIFNMAVFCPLSMTDRLLGISIGNALYFQLFWCCLSRKDNVLELFFQYKVFFLYNLARFSNTNEHSLGPSVEGHVQTWPLWIELPHCFRSSLFLASICDFVFPKCLVLRWHDN